MAANLTVDVLDPAGKKSGSVELPASIFEAGQKVDVVGTSKGKGTAGVMKRHGFAGVSASHGAHRNHRKPGSIGGASTPGRVFKGQRMAGRMGGDRTSVQNLTVHAVDVEKGLVLVKGAVPGANSSAASASQRRSPCSSGSTSRSCILPVDAARAESSAD